MLMADGLGLYLTRVHSVVLWVMLYSCMTNNWRVEVIILGFTLKCPMPGCNAQLSAENKDDLLKQGMEHAKTHGMAAMAPDMMSKLQGAIKQS